MVKLYFLISIILSLLLVSTTFVSSARILDETTPPIPTDTPDSSDPAPEPTNPTVAPTVPPTTDTIPAVGPLPDPTTNVAPTAPTEPTGPTDPVLSLTPALAPVVPPVSDPPTDTPTTTTTPATTTPTTATGAAATTVTGAAAATSDHVISFFMHDIIGGSHPSGRVVTGVVTSTDAAQNLPFSKPNNQVFPINGGVPLNTINGVINNNNYPFLVGLNGSPGSTGTGGAALAQTNGNSVPANNNNQAFVTAGQLPQGVTLQQLMFGSVTVVDNEVTEGHELGTAVLGRAQGFYIVSSTDGTSHTLALTVLFEHHGGEETDDSVSFFGIHRTATPVSHVAVVGGTGKYENAKGYATIETMPHEDQHTTDGVETITHVTIYLTP